MITTTGFQEPAISREGLVPSVFDKILLVGATDTPLLNLIGKTKAYNILHSWHIDTLPDPRNLPRLEVHQLGEAPKATTQKNSNHMQHTIDEVRISNTMQNVKEYGGQNPWDREKGKVAKSHALNLEYTFFGAGGEKEDFFNKYTERTETEAGKAAGIFYYVSKGEEAFKEGRRGNVVAFDSSKDWTGDPQPLTWDTFMQLLQIPWNKGVQAKDVFVGGKLRGRIDELRGTRGHTTIISDKTLNVAVDKIQTDFGEVRIHSHRFLNAQNKLDDVMIVGDFDYAKNALLMETVFKEYETGHTAKGGYFETENCLCILNADAFAIGVGISATSPVG